MMKQTVFASFAGLLTGLMSIFSCAVYAESWRDVAPENTAIMTLDQGAVVIEITDQFAPANAKRFSELIRSGFYDGKPFYRVIDGFVYQAGGQGKAPVAEHLKSTVKAEFEQPLALLNQFTPVQSPDMYAPEVGFSNGFAVAKSQQLHWPVHCPGVINLARNNDIDSATTEFALMDGQSPRHLDRNMSVVARVIDGKQHLRSVKIGDQSGSGMHTNIDNASQIQSIKLLSQLKNTDYKYQVEDTHTDSFAQRLAERRKLANPFFHYKGEGVLDICYLKVKSKKVSNHPAKKEH